MLDDAPNLQGTRVGGVPVLGPVDAAADHPDAAFLVCAGRGASRAAIVERLTALGVGRGPLRDVRAPARQRAADLPDRLRERAARRYRPDRRT